MKAFPRARRIAAVASAALAACLALAACGGNFNSDDDRGSSEAELGYPTIVDSAYGEITLDKEPERILVMSPAYVDMLTAIDVQPIAFATGAISEDEFDRSYPWLAGEYEGEIAPELMTSELKPDLEEIANYKPDLILGHTWTISEDVYGEVSKIAPTYVGTDDGSTITEWTSDMEAVGDLTGQAGAMKSALEEFDSKVAEYRKQVAQLDGKTFNSVAVRDDGYQYGSGGWLALLGLNPAAKQGNYTDTPLSFENMTELSADVLLAYAWTDETRARLEDDPRFPKLPAATTNAVVIGDLPMANAATYLAPGALEYLMERVVPILEKSSLNQSA